MFIAIMKHYMYSSRCMQNKLSFLNFVEKIVYWYNVEKMLAYEKGNLNSFKKKWKNYAEV